MSCKKEGNTFKITNSNRNDYQRYNITAFHPPICRKYLKRDVTYEKVFYHKHESENARVSVYENSLFNEIFYIPCPEGGRHTMTQHGVGELSQNGKEVIAHGFAFQCSKCLKAIVSEYSPKSHGKLGTYGVEQVSWRLQTSYSMRYPDYVGYNSSTSPTSPPWDSYVWR